MANKTTLQDIKNIEDLASFCKRRGFVFAGSEIYGGLSGFWDYGPLGVELKNSIKQNWWKKFVQDRDDMIGIDGSIISRENVWMASGHVDSFKDAIVNCPKCKKDLRADHLIENETGINAEGMPAKELNKIININKITCPKCKSKLSKAKYLSLMLSTKVGSSEGKLAYLRPETCQSIFINFKNVIDSTRIKLPFGLAQTGKAFRNEISPRDFLFRVRELEQMEIEFFADDVNACPFFSKISNKKANILTAKEQKKKNPKVQKMTFGELFKKNLVKSKWHTYWIFEHYNWFLRLGVKSANLRLREHTKDELSHYSMATFDIEYKFPFGWKELGGNADRGCFDLTQHAKHSKVDLSIFDDRTQKRIIPRTVAEPSQGVDRAFLAILADAHTLEKDRIVLKLKPSLAPIKVAVFPLLRKDNLPKLARKVYDNLKEKYVTFYDEVGSIGKRYRRMDEIGTPYCITIDHDSLKKKDVTLRDRDTMKQKRIKIKNLEKHLLI